MRHPRSKIKFEIQILKGPGNLYTYVGISRISGRKLQISKKITISRVNCNIYDESFQNFTSNWFSAEFMQKVSEITPERPF